MRNTLVLFLVAGHLLACSQTDAPQQSGVSTSPASQADLGMSPDIGALEAPQNLAAFFDEFFEQSLKLQPIQATFLGDKRYNDYLPNLLGEAYRQQSREFEANWLEKAQKINRNELGQKDQISLDVFVHNRKDNLEGFDYPGYLIPINQFFGLHNFLALLGSGGSAQPFDTVADFEAFLKRIDGAAVIFDQAILNMREGMARNVVQPRVLMEKVLPQLKIHMVENPRESVFFKPVAAMPADIDDAERQRITDLYTLAITKTVVPMYTRLHDFIRDEYIPSARQSVGRGDVENGINWYNYAIRSNTTTQLTADEIHEFGLQDVAAIHAEIDKIRTQVGFEGDLAAFFRHMKSDQFYPASEAEVLAAYEAIRERVNRTAPELFDLLPKADYELRPFQAYRVETAAPAEYHPPSPDGERPGVFYVNSAKLKSQPTWFMETLSLHEASPGHHFQISIAQEIEDIPRFQRFGGFTAYSEGWGLYAESLGTELGFFTDPYSLYGHLDARLWRAMRLVVDTGLHAKGWSREQAIDYMKENSAIDAETIVAEVERYIAIPGQALSYRIGEKVIRELRNDAERRLGERFDIKAFHRQILTDGALPMDLLRTKIGAWIEQEEQGKSS